LLVGKVVRTYHTLDEAANDLGDAFRMIKKQSGVIKAHIGNEDIVNGRIMGVHNYHGRQNSRKPDSLPMPPPSSQFSFRRSNSVIRHQKAGRRGGLRSLDTKNQGKTRKNQGKSRETQENPRKKKQEKGRRKKDGSKSVQGPPKAGKKKKKKGDRKLFFCLFFSCSSPSPSPPPPPPPPPQQIFIPGPPAPVPPAAPSVVHHYGHGRGRLGRGRGRWGNGRFRRPYGRRPRYWG
jgi:hypothetical protein